MNRPAPGTRATPINDARCASGARGVFDARVVKNEPLCPEHHRFVLEVEGFPPAAPGQFIQILCHNTAADAPIGHPLLRRPFSIGGLRRAGRRAEIDILHRVVGDGTGWLSRLEPGQAVSIIGPLGQPFQIFDDRPVAFLVGGGIGLPPLIWLAQALRQAGKQTVAFCGGRSADLLPLTRQPDVTIAPDVPAAGFAEFAQFDVPVVISTDDGSLGTRGTCSEVFARYLARHGEQARSAVVYTCGPEPMMRAVAAVCEQSGARCQVCLERVMACGMGTCQSCVVRLRDDQADDGWRYRLCCTDGPVFDSRLVLWDA